MIVYGRNVIYALLESNINVFEYFLRDDIYERDFKVVKLIKEKNIKLTVLNKEQMNNKFKGLNQGYGASIDEIPTYQIEDLIKPNKKQLFVILDQLEDPQNLGNIFRTCDAFSVDGIIVPNKGNIKITDTVVKVSTGSVFFVPLVVTANINNMITKLKKNNVWVVGTDMDGDITLKDLKFDRSLAIVIGSEGFGMRDLVKKNCDMVTSIPMTGHVNSLNASISCAIVVSHLLN